MSSAYDTCSFYSDISADNQKTFAQFEEKFKADRLTNFEKLFLECSDEDREELLAVFAENISLGFPHSEEITRKSLAGFSEKFIQFILQAKNSSSTQHEGTDQLFISINDLLLNESTSISAQFSQEIAQSYVNQSSKTPRFARAQAGAGSEWKNARGLRRARAQN